MLLGLRFAAAFASAGLAVLPADPSAACAGQAIPPAPSAVLALAIPPPAAPEADSFPCGCWNYIGADECPRWWHLDVRFRPLLWSGPPPLVAPRATGGGMRHIDRFYSASELAKTALRPWVFDCRDHPTACPPSGHRGTLTSHSAG